MLTTGSRGMNYCSLNEAFPSSEGGVAPGCQQDYSSKEARKEERRKARKCKGPPATFLEITDDKDPDRQNLNKLPIIPAMNPVTGLREHAPVDAPQGSLEPFVPRNDDDPVGDAARATLPLDVSGLTQMQKPSAGKKAFFGADPDTDGFADYIPDQESYRLQPDFLKAFEEAGLGKAGSTGVLPQPSINQYWKPITPSGAQTAFIEHLPPSDTRFDVRSSSMLTNDEVMKKLDKLFAKLDDSNRGSPEQATSELLMFISSGIFVIFLMDLLLKKGSTMRFLKGF
jgi:hypothetical protein